MTESIQEYPNQLLKTVPTSKILQLHLMHSSDALFVHFKQSENMSLKKYIVTPKFTF